MKQLHSIDDLSKDDVLRIYDDARSFAKTDSKHPHSEHLLNGKTVLLAFFENSTRTRISFELAAKRLSANVVSFNSSGSSVAKGESLLDTLSTIESMGVDAIVVRHSSAGVLQYYSRYTTLPMINAGDGKHEHPTQALLDCYSLIEKVGSLSGVNVTILGDLLHSRVARSNIKLLKMLGANVGVFGPGSLLHGKSLIGAFPFITLHASLQAAIEWSDAVNVLRLQNERMVGGFLPSMNEYNKHFGLVHKKAQQKRSLLILHPGPVNYGIEIDFATASSQSSLIRRQTKNGVAIRMAVLASLKL